MKFLFWNIGGKATVAPVVLIKKTFKHTAEYYAKKAAKAGLGFAGLDGTLESKLKERILNGKFDVKAYFDNIEKNRKRTAARWAAQRDAYPNARRLAAKKGGN